MSNASDTVCDTSYNVMMSHTHCSEQDLVLDIHPVQLIASVFVSPSADGTVYTTEANQRVYELSNHPEGSGQVSGNVLATFSSFNTNPSRITPLQPLKNDEVMFQDHKMNIIVGMSESAGGILGSGSTKITQGDLEISVFGQVDDQIGRVRTRDAKKTIETDGAL